MDDDDLKELRENLADLTELQEAIEELSTQGLELGSQQQDLAELINLQKENAVNVLDNDHEALKKQLSVAFNSRDRAILAALPQQTRTPWNPLSLDTAPANPVAAACQDIIKQYDLLAKLAMQANKRLNGVYAEFLETEDELVALAEELKGLEEEFAELEGMEEMSDKIQEALENLTELEEETEKNVERTRITHIMWQEDKRHEQKVYTHLKDVA